MSVSPPFAASASYPPRTTDGLAFFVDGEDAFASIAQAIESAERYVYVTCAYASLNFRLRPPATEQLLDLCARVSARGVTVALLFWKPTGNVDGTVPESEQGQIAAKAPGVRARWDVANTSGVYPKMLGCHHQKTFVVDGKIAFVGGINMTQDYWDSCAHQSDDDRRVSYEVTDPSARQKLIASALPLHDVFARFDGPAVADVEANFVERYNGATVRLGADLPAPSPPSTDPGGASRIQILRTIAPHTYAGTASGEQSIKQGMLNVIGAAQKSIYFENQYFFDDDVVAALRSAGERGVRVVGLLARAPDADQWLGRVESMIEDGEESKFQWIAMNPILKQRVQLYSPFTSDSIEAKDIYVHSKTLIADDRWVIAGSANISFTSLDFHSEMSILVEDPAIARALRGRLWAEHLCCSPDRIADDFEAGADAWAQASARNASLRGKSILPTRVIALSAPSSPAPDQLASGEEDGDPSLT
jgi:phosphatidylserine/phosphatidylglycerophosphate/cardiolipin synthase-like enzyme